MNTGIETPPPSKRILSHGLERGELWKRGGLDQAELAGVRESGFRRLGEIVMGRIELPDELVEAEGGLPNLAEEAAAGAIATDSAATVHGRVIAFVAGAAAIKFSRADLQLQVGGSRLRFFGGVRVALHRRLKVFDSFAQAFTQVGHLAPAEQHHGDEPDH
jgi:hypothetical protein